MNKSNLAAFFEDDEESPFPVRMDLHLLPDLLCSSQWDFIAKERR